MKLKIKTGTIGYNNKILISDEKFSLGKNDEVNLMVLAIKSHKTNSLAQKPNFSHNEKQEPQPLTHNDKKVASYFLLQVVLQYGIFFDELIITILRTVVLKILYDSRYSLCSYKVAIMMFEMTPDVVYVPINFSLRF